MQYSEEILILAYICIGSEGPKNKTSILKSENNKPKNEKTKSEGEIHELGRCRKTEFETEPNNDQPKTAADGRYVDECIMHHCTSTY